MSQRAPNMKVIPLDIVGSTAFGRYPKVSSEETYNLIISDNFLVDYAGYKAVIQTANVGPGRGIFNSVRLGKLVVVINNNVYTVDQNNLVTLVGQLATYAGDVFMDENDANQIAICDKTKIYIYSYLTGAFVIATTDFQPGYVAFQDGYFIAPVIGTNIGSGTWRLSALNNGTSWPNDSFHVGTFQTKPDSPVACIRFPARGNLLWVMGSIVTEAWQDVGGALFPYQRSSSYNIDYGCLNPATIAFGDSFIVWLGTNEKMGPVILWSNGNDVQVLSNDGINFKLAELNNPSNAYGFLFKQDGHIFYQLTFPDPTDNLTYTYDFTTQKFFTLCDEKMNAHIARRIAFFNDSYYFVSGNDGNIYELSTNYTNYDYGNITESDGSVVRLIQEIPRIRICKTVRVPDNSPWIANNLTFIVEEGIEDNLPSNFPTVVTQDYIVNVGLNQIDVSDSSIYFTGMPATLTNTTGNLPSPLVTSATYFIIVVSTGVIQLATTYQNAVAGIPIVLTTAGTGTNNISIVPQPLGPRRIDMSISRDGGQSFGNYTSYTLNPVGTYKNRVQFWQLGYANEFTPQFRFWAFNRVVVGDGTLSIYQ